MPLSSRLIKSMQASSSDLNDWVIDTAYEVEEEEPDEYSEANEEARNELELAKQKSAELIEKAQTEKEQLIEEAMQEVEQLKEEAYKTAFEEGKQAGFEAGYKEGNEAGFTAGKQESEQLIKVAQQSVTEAQEAITKYIEEKKDSLLSLSVHMAEKIVHEQLDLLPEGILELVHPILHQLDRKEDYVSLTVHSSMRQKFKEQIPMLEKAYPGVRFIVLQDDNVEQYGCVIESAHKVVDVQVRKQLDALVEEMKEREREM
ncbi:flagellar assembly protein FliH [Alkalibacterium subtropicum]|uniref:Flagellar assembly protein FliH n=1 Tax=Alkalibacterium subtropicum TaxID=753702 RepID=A0A1I1IV75_9LACT|nr:FliH/SctL family protein [Alkalibacterium subtropicum]SFC40209.1 flagellar assembly protein FliH [Alkalibacterium subtropicum]